MLWAAVKYVYKKDCYKNQYWDKDIALMRFFVATFLKKLTAKTGKAMAWLVPTALYIMNSLMMLKDSG